MKGGVLILSLCLLAGSVYRDQMPCPLIVLLHSKLFYYGSVKYRSAFGIA